MHVRQVNPMAAVQLLQASSWRAQRLEWLLRLGVAGEFVGHGWVGIGRPTAWLPFFQVFGISPVSANMLMPLIGAWDICVGLLMLVLPLRFLLIWTFGWGLFTAVLRPLAGQGSWEFLERAGNFGVPLALLLIVGVRANRWSGRDWLRPAPIQSEVVDQAKLRWLEWLLRLTVAGLLIGHGGLGAFMHRQEWMAYFGVLGFDVQTVGDRSLIELVGWFEIALGAIVLLRPAGGLLAFVFCWKVLTESLRPLAGEEFGQFVECSGSFAAPLALTLLSRYRRQAQI